FPTSSYNSENYWVDVVFQESAADTTPPSLVDHSPARDATGVPTNTLVTATYGEALQSGTGTIAVRNASNALVPGTVSLDTGGTRLVFQPAQALDTSATYSVQVSGVSDPAGNVAPSASWSFQTAAPAAPAPDQGPGGPIGVVTSAGNPVSTYLAEIMRAEGLNEFETVGPAALTETGLAPYGTLVVGEVPVTDAQVAAVADWVTAGGDLVLMRPDSRFNALAGLTAQAGTVSEGYLAVDGSSEPGAGITTETLQFHGAANRYALSGASSVATLYTSATASTGLPAVSWRSVGSNGGQVATFAYDLARSVVLTHQGNPAWSGQDRDGQAPIRSDDLYFGGTSTDWVNLSKVQIPQADEQQRLLANLITVMARDRMPVPRFWYFPDTHRAVVVATGDDHGTGGTGGRFDTYLANSPSGCSVAAWTCPRFTSYVYTSTPLSNAQATSYQNQGFEVGLHHSTGCGDFTSLSSLQSGYSSQLSAWRAKYTGLPSPVTNRTHCIVFSDWSSQPRAELANGIRLDTNYYFWPGSWVQDRPGFMNGSGIPMRFTDTDGSLIDVYQTQTVMTDESEQTYPATPNTLLDRALGPLGYYGAFTANMHTDSATTFESDQLLASAQARGVPIVSARQMLTWLDGRNGSSFRNLSWSGSRLSFSIGVGSGASRLTAMLPTSGPGGTALTALTRDGVAVAFARMTVKGQEYATFSAASGAWSATYAAAAAPTIAAARVAESTEDSVTIAWSTEVPATSTVLLANGSEPLREVATETVRTTEHLIVLDGLAPGTTYRYRVLSRTPGGRTDTWPSPGQPTATFRSAAADDVAPSAAQLRVVSLPDGTARVAWTTSEPATSEVEYERVPGLGTHHRLDEGLVRDHLVVLTGLRPDTTYAVRVRSVDGSGNTSASLSTSVLTRPAGVAVQTAESLRRGTVTGRLRIGEDGFGALALPSGGAGSYTSGVLDAGQKADWTDLALADLVSPAGSRWTLSVRTGSSPESDGTWSPWRQVSAGQVGGSGRYLQFRLTVTAPAGSRWSVSGIGFTHTGGLPRTEGEGTGALG
ncbi:hypothetical protein E8D34_10615, partial [Nocardioides sp. GY 10113]|uniref:Ig-like domain-containing protein n=1 Tax=Nocardioides sp. GY 10113 TaxID=2569761 RepID=UPI001138B465